MGPSPPEEGRTHVAGSMHHDRLIALAVALSNKRYQLISAVGEVQLLPAFATHPLLTTGVWNERSNTLTFSPPPPPFLSFLLMWPDGKSPLRLQQYGILLIVNLDFPGWTAMQCKMLDWA